MSGSVGISIRNGKSNRDIDKNTTGMSLACMLGLFALLGTGGCASTGHAPSAHSSSATSGENVVQNSGAADARAATAPSDQFVASRARTANLADGADNGDVEICRKMTVTGSKFTKRVCGTKAQWRRVEASTEERRKDLRRTIRAQSGQSSR